MASNLLTFRTLSVLALCIEFLPVLATVQTPFQKLTFKIMEIQTHISAHPSGPHYVIVIVNSFMQIFPLSAKLSTDLDWCMPTVCIWIISLVPVCASVSVCFSNFIPLLYLVFKYLWHSLLSSLAGKALSLHLQLTSVWLGLAELGFWPRN